MARLTIEECWWTDPRRERLSELVGGIDQADVIALKAWRLAQEFWKHACGLVPKDLFYRLKCPDALIEAGLADACEDAIYVRGSKDYLTWAAEMRDAQAKGGRSSAARPRDARGRLLSAGHPPSELQVNSKFDPASSKAHHVSDSVSDSGSVFVLDSDSNSEIIAKSVKKRRVEKPQGSDGEASRGVTNPDGVSPTALAWRAYKQAFEAKYGEAPPWNAKIAGQLRQLCGRVPAEEAPDVARFYLTHNEYRYVKAMHPVGMLLQDAEKLRTEWVTGRRVSDTQARQADKLSHAQDQLARIAKGEL